MAYDDFKDLSRRTAYVIKQSYVIKHLILLKIRNILGIKVDLIQRSISFLIKKSLFHIKVFWWCYYTSDKYAIKNEIMPNQQLPGKLH